MDNEHEMPKVAQVSLARELVSKDKNILREELKEFDFDNPTMDPITLAHTLAQSCIEYEGLGLSANQIGLRERACIINGLQMICMINPVIVDASLEQQSYMEEGCLTFPNLFIKIKRPDVIRIRYAMPNGETVTNRFVGMTSRVIQHEVDHLDGILFMDRATKVHLEQARTKKKQADRAGDKRKTHVEEVLDAREERQKRWIT